MYSDWSYLVNENWNAVEMYIILNLQPCWNFSLYFTPNLSSEFLPKNSVLRLHPSAAQSQSKQTRKILVGFSWVAICSVFLCPSSAACSKHNTRWCWILFTFYIRCLCACVCLRELLCDLKKKTSPPLIVHNLQMSRGKHGTPHLPASVLFFCSCHGDIPSFLHTHRFISFHAVHHYHCDGSLPSRITVRVLTTDYQSLPQHAPAN